MGQVHSQLLGLESESAQGVSHFPLDWGLDDGGPTIPIRHLSVCAQQISRHSMSSLELVKSSPLHFIVVNR